MAIFGWKKHQVSSPLPPNDASSAQMQSQWQDFQAAPLPAYSHLPPRLQAPNYNEYGPSRPSQPQGWDIPLSSPPNQQIFVQQNFVLNAPQTEYQEPQRKVGKLSKLNLGSVPNLLTADLPNYVPGARVFNDGMPLWQQRGTQYLNQSAALYDLISSKLDAIVNLIDGENFSGDERDLAINVPPSVEWEQEQDQYSIAKQETRSKNLKLSPNNVISSALTSTNYFAKVNLYANSRLTQELPSMKLYISTYPLISLAAQYSQRVYTKPKGAERETHVDADWRMGTKAMVIKSVPMDDMDTIVFAIRGSQTFMDWAVNLNSAPLSPAGFLDDPGNHCHAGFLTAARKMVGPVASRLRALLQEDPGRTRYSLLITGHSAGGAVAALLYSHMLSTHATTASELSTLMGFFKRVHCITFGAPPVSLLPLQTPPATTTTTRGALRKSLFLAFVNEGDPVPRADRRYVRSLLDLYSSPAPGQTCLDVLTAARFRPRGGGASSSSSDIKPTTSSSSSALHLAHHSRSATDLRDARRRATAAAATAAGDMPVWPVPPCELSNAGRLVLLRGVGRAAAAANERGSMGKKQQRARERADEDGVRAQMVTDEQLRGVVWGDPVCHMMKLYARRVEILAMNAVLGRSLDLSTPKVQEDKNH